MSTALPPSESAPPGTRLETDTEGVRRVDYLIVYGHSNILYWWPVWFVAFILAAVTYAEGQQMAVVPHGTVVERNRGVDGMAGRHDVLVAPEGKSFNLAREEGERNPAGMTVSTSNGLGVIFVATLLIVALTSTVLFRGLVSVIVLIAMIALVIAFELLGWWNDILWYVGGLDIRMNAAGYLAIAIPLLLVWLVVVFLYDRATYIIFDSGQVRYVHEVGDAEISLQSEGAIVEKKRNDVFRHILLGFGTGDLKIRFGGGNGPTLELENVIGINRKMALIQQLVKEKSITVEA